ncbi:MAG: LacI family DNA-binding transcriptional regulator [Candidatus Accumulibacter sp.]|nr:LacI family DNA-binding transcriptional regulator [Accumulibacter sp.]
MKGGFPAFAFHLSRAPGESIITPKRPSIKDVAQLARVSTGTVSMVLNDNPSVSPKTRARVKQAIQELRYIYNRSGAQLRKKRKGVVGVSICDLANPYFSEITVGIEEALGELGFALFLGHAGESVEQQGKFLNLAREHNVDGLILMPAVGTPRKIIETIADWHIPLVLVSRYVAGISTDYSGADNRAGLATATGHLLALGHKKIAFVGANAHTTTGRDRVRGYKAAMKSAGLAIPPGFIVECEATRKHGFLAAQKLFGGPGEAPTAIVCFNDLLAFGVMLGLRNMGMEPGRDCSVVGTDDVIEAALWQPGLTTMAIRPRLIGQNAGKLFHKRLESPDQRPEKVLLEPELVVRDSSWRLNR